MCLQGKFSPWGSFSRDFTEGGLGVLLDLQHGHLTISALEVNR